MKTDWSKSKMGLMEREEKEGYQEREWRRERGGEEEEREGKEGTGEKDTREGGTKQKVWYLRVFCSLLYTVVIPIGPEIPQGPVILCLCCNSVRKILLC